MRMHFAAFAAVFCIFGWILLTPVISGAAEAEAFTPSLTLTGPGTTDQGSYVTIPYVLSAPSAMTFSGAVTVNGDAVLLSFSASGGGQTNGNRIVVSGVTDGNEGVREVTGELRFYVSGSSTFSVTFSGRAASMDTFETADLSKTLEIAVTPHEGLMGFVTRLYTDCLGRQPDLSGYRDWTNALATGIRNGTEVAFGFVFSDEQKSRNLCDADFIKMLYRTLLGREAEEEGYAYWIRMLRLGYAREEIFNRFSRAVEFQDICASSGVILGEEVSWNGYGTLPSGNCAVCGEAKASGAPMFVRRLYLKCLQREPDESGHLQWVNGLEQHIITGKETAEGFFFSPEFMEKAHSDESFVRLLYQTMLDREPDDTGFQSWVTGLKNGVRREDIFLGFVISSEFKGICEYYGIIPE